MKSVTLLLVFLTTLTSHADVLVDARARADQYEQQIKGIVRQEISVDESMKNVQRAYAYTDKAGNVVAIDDMEASGMGDGVLDVKINRYYVEHGVVALVRTSDTFIFTIKNGQQSKPFNWGGDILVFENGHLKEWFLMTRIKAAHDDPEWARTETFLLNTFGDLIQRWKKSHT